MHTKTGSPRQVLLIAGACVLTLLSGCGGGSTGSASSERQQSSASSVEGPVAPLGSFAEIYERVEYNSIVYTSLEQVRQSASIIVDGTWKEIAEGRTLYEDTGETRIETRYAVASIAVTRALGGSPSGDEEAIVYMEVPIPDDSSFEDVQRVYPTGARVIAALAEWDPSEQPAGIEQENLRGGLPEGSRLTSDLPGILYIDGELPYRLPELSTGLPREVETLDEVAAFFAGEG